MCSGQTGHAEIVEVQYDPGLVSFRDLLKLFWSIHDPTVDTRHYRGGQYRSAIFYTTKEQSDEAVAEIKQLQSLAGPSRPVVTQVAPAPKFWRAEEYHQQYYKKNKAAAFCR